jgi:DNA-binding NtrC family response regulator
MSRLLVVDDEPAMRSALQANFSRRGWQVETASGAKEAITRFRRGRHPLVITDIRMPDGNGIEVMREIQSTSSRTAIILLTAFANVPDAVEAIKKGACDYMVKPVSFEQLEQTAIRALQRLSLSDEGEMIGHSPVWLAALERVRQAGATTADILLQAESGTGKELVARYIHRISARRDRAFVAVNCAAFPETLLESELFGHTRGAFTGADTTKPGKFELAHGGTLLLDEVGEIPLPLQPKLLRALQEREFDRLGDSHPIQVDIRVIATTNRSLTEMIEHGQFRADLYYRLNVIPLTLPTLRERREDIKELAAHFARLYSTPAAVARLSPEFVSRLEEYAWPGNVRELANFMRRAVALCRAGEIGMDLLENTQIQAAKDIGDRIRAGMSVEKMERRLLEMTLDATGGNRTRAAELLGVSLRTVRNKIRAYGLPRRSYAND